MKKTNLPQFFVGERRGLLLVLVGLGLAQAALGIAVAWAMISLQDAATSTVLAVAIATLACATFAIGALRVHERGVSEKLGQSYVKEIRRELVRASLTPGGTTSLGITVARTTNDLTSVKNWVSQGIAPLAVTIPLVIGVIAGFAFLDWRIACAALIPVVVLVIGILLWARRAYTQSRALRKTRGAMASRIAQTVTAADSIVMAGGEHREIRNIDKVSQKVSTRAVERAETLGLLRSSGVVAASLMPLVVAVTGTLVSLDPAVVVAAMAIAGIASTSLTDMGRIVEFRQSYLAALAVLDPHLGQARERREASDTAVERTQRKSSEFPTASENTKGTTISLGGLLRSSIRIDDEEIVALSGERTVLETALARVGGLEFPPEGHTDHIVVGGTDLAALPGSKRRDYLGIAKHDSPFERSSVWRAVRYRYPKASKAETHEVLEAVGLSSECFPRGFDTQIRQGGKEFDADTRARLLLARAMLGTPPLLIVDGLEHGWDRNAGESLSMVLGRYEGICILLNCPDTARNLHARVIDVRHVDDRSGRTPTEEIPVIRPHKQEAYS